MTGLRDSRTGTDYLAPGKSASLVSLVIDGQQVRPTAVTPSRSHRGLLTFTNPKAGFAVDVKVENKGGYATLEAVRVKGPAGADVQTLLWGPMATSLTQTIGETVGVVRDNDFAIGLRPLTDRTEGAWPQEYQQFGWESEVEDNPSRLQVAPHEEWSVAGRTAWGSVLRSFTYDYTRERERQNIDGYRIPVGPLPGADAYVTGSKVALFGASPEMTPTVLSNIATGEDLPYPTQNGQWQKSAQVSSQSFLVLGDLRTANIPTAARFAKAAGIGYIYSLPNAVGPWQSTGHYQFDARLGGSDAGAAAAVDIAKANGVRLGVHTISDFISTDDPYIASSPADDRLATGGHATLTRPLSPGDTTLYLDSDALLADGVYGRLLRIGDEFVGYDAARQVGAEWEVTGLHRAQWSSVAADHATGNRTARVVTNGYGGAIGGRGIIKEISTRLATAWNNTGIMSNSYDGVESASQSGWGSYGQARLINGAYKGNRAKDGFITETSRMTSNTWDALTRASWGEVGVTSMNQVFINNAFYQDNFLPGMLGWIKLSGTEDLLSIEGVLARGAGLNAGAGFQASVAGLTASGKQGELVLDAIKQWDTARNLGAFTEAQKARFRDQSTHWHLTVTKPGKEWSLQELDTGGNPIGSAQDVTTPTPRLSSAPLPTATTHELYEAKVTTNTPATVRFEVTGGALPKGLRLNKDTGGITGKPARATKAAFTITAHSAAGLPDAQADYRITARP
ncbi:Ig domain-containing protein [Streptomyces sp. NPDC007164]|uniref:Ig domain-containing protein n=1 Tax=Streptomyces sp. NPDC007164 TaxID=3156918 RepID=UPI0033F4EB61